MMELTLRPYQEEATDAFFSALSEHKRQLISLPTGTGKTIVFGAVAKRFARVCTAKRPILVIAHRAELLDQAAEKIRFVWPEARIGRVQAERNEQENVDVIVASTQTLVAGRKLLQTPSLIIYDEAHHSRANGAYKVLTRLGVFADDGPPLLGVTATPFRADDKEIGDIFTHLAYEKTILEMILNRYLVDVRAKQIVVPTMDLGKMKKTAGDYNTAALSAALSDSEALRIVVDAVKTHASDRKAIVFAVDVAHGNALAELFRREGIASGMVEGKMKPDERKEILKDFGDNRLRVLVNCMILTEGFDMTDVDTIVIARPTRSKVLYTQMIGRALRLHPGKEHALILDMTGATNDKSLQTMARLMKSQAETEEEPDLTTTGVFDWLVDITEKRETLAAIARDINLFADRARYRWQPVPMPGGHTLYAISYEDHKWAFLYRDGDRYWPILQLDATKSREKFLPLYDHPLSLEYAQGIAEGYLAYFESSLIKKDANWRDLPISPKQAELLRGMGVTSTIDWTKGYAADVLGTLFAKKQVKILTERFHPRRWLDFVATPEGKEKFERRLRNLQQ